jgi:hypothetical protein
MGLLFLLGARAIEITTRRGSGAVEPHTLSTGDSWQAWHRFGMSVSTVQRYLEPGLFLCLGLTFGTFDPFLYRWFIWSGLSLFVKEQIEHHKLNRRVLDSIDAKQSGQILTNAIKAFQQRPGSVVQRTHQARLP